MSWGPSEGKQTIDSARIRKCGVTVSCQLMIKPDVWLDANVDITLTDPEQLKNLLSSARGRSRLPFEEGSKRELTPSH